MTQFQIGKPDGPIPVINFWLEQSSEGCWLVAKHSADAASQNVAFFRLRDGTLTIEAHNIFASHLCEALGIAKGNAPQVAREESKQ